MNNSFSSRRFRNYFLFDLRTLRGNIGMMVLLMGLAPIILYVFYMLFGNLFSGDFLSRLLTGPRISGPSLGARIGVFVAVTFIFSILFPSRAYGFITDDLVSSSRRQPLVLARQIAMYLCRRMTKSSFPEIGAAFGKTHATALHAHRCIEKRSARDKQINQAVERILRQLEDSSVAGIKS